MNAPAPAPAPVEVHAPRGADVLAIVWDDGVETAYSHRLLRGMCPCARCQGHSGSTRFVDGDSSELRRIEEVGDYALRLCWPDCETGIYSFEYLRRLADLDPKTLKVGELVSIQR